MSNIEIILSNVSPTDPWPALEEPLIAHLEQAALPQPAVTLNTSVNERNEHAHSRP